METYSLRNSIKESAARHSDSITDSGLIFRVIIEEDVPDLYYGDSAYILEVIDHMITASLLRTEEGIIFLTSMCDKETVLKCRACGATDYILKPANHTYLRERVRIALNDTRD